MGERVIRSTKHPKPPNTFERLRARAEARTSTHPVERWLDQATSVPSLPTYHHSPDTFKLPTPSSFHSTRQFHLRSRRAEALALQPTHGNRSPHLPSASPPTAISRKRKMPDSSHPNLRQSARNKKKNIQLTSADDGPSAKDNDRNTTRTSQQSRKVVSKNNEDGIFDTAEDTWGDGGPLSLGNPMPRGGRPAGGMELSNSLVFAGGYVKLPMASSTPSKTPSSPSKKVGSPSKGLVVNKRERMKFMEPRVTFTTLQDTNVSGYLTGKLQKLWHDMDWYEPKVIPSAFKMEIYSEFDTPNKTKPQIPINYFGAPQNRYAEDDYALMRLTIQDVLNLADEYRHSGCTEAHWISIVVSPLLNLVRRLKRYQKTDSRLAVLDITSVEISPSTLCPTSSDSVFKDLDKRIDAAIGLNLSSKKRESLITGVYSEGIPSINQTTSFVNFIPMFANIEVKRPNTDRDPLIQLGTWIAAEFKKSQKEGYSLDMPVLAIAIDGDTWDLHMVFAPEDHIESSTFKCRFVGPMEMGTAKDLYGIYQILNRLCCCADWGIGEYQSWFNEQILAKYKG